MRRACLAVLLLMATAATVVAQPAARPTASALTITSPQGRTGAVMRVRIVAQVALAPGLTLSPVNFYVDGTLVGTVTNGPPFAVEWVEPGEGGEARVHRGDERVGRRQVARLTGAKGGVAIVVGDG